MFAKAFAGCSVPSRVAIVTGGFGPSQCAAVLVVYTMLTEFHIQVMLLHYAISGS